MDYSTLKKRYAGLDLLRVISAAVVCAFHTTIHLGADYGILQSVSQMGAVFMTAFFMLSGYTLFVNYAGSDIMKKEALGKFWLKRIIAIVPMYYIASLLFIFHRMRLSSDPMKVIIENLWLAPIEALGIQSNFSSLFNYSHNGGTWFISCLLICYLAYPFLQEVFKPLSARTKTILICICSFILLYSPFVVAKFGIANIYSNPFFRLLEFGIGILLASLKPKLDESIAVRRLLYNRASMVMINILMAAGITVAVKRGFAPGNYMMYSLICLPCFIIMIIGMSGIEFDSLKHSRVLSYCSSIAYVFFLAQLFSNNICKSFLNKHGITGNVTIILIGWGVCIVIALFFRHALEKPLTAWLKDRFIDQNQS